MLDRRTRYFIKKHFQIRYILFVFLAMLIPTGICGGALYYLMWQTIAAEIGIPEAIESQIMPALNKVDTALMFILPIVFLGMITLSVYISHKIAGPSYRLENELKEILKGDYSRRIKLRSHDELQEIAELVNKLLDQIAEKQKK